MRTLKIPGAGSDLVAADPRVTRVSVPARAEGRVVDGLAEGVAAAHSLQFADVLALVGHAGLSGGAVGVFHTLQLGAADLGVARPPWRAGTPGTVVGDDALGVDAAVAVARVLALAVLADSVRGAFGVRVALRLGFAASAVGIADHAVRAGT